MLSGLVPRGRRDYGNKRDFPALEGVERLLQQELGRLQLDNEATAQAGCRVKFWIMTWRVAVRCLQAASGKPQQPTVSPQPLDLLTGVLTAAI